MPVPGCRGQEPLGGRAACAGVLVVIAMAARRRRRRPHARRMTARARTAKVRTARGMPTPRPILALAEMLWEGGLEGVLVEGWGGNGDGDGAG